MNELLVTTFSTLLAAVPPGDVGADPAAVANVSVESVWDFVRKGGVMMIPIGICSLIALTVFMERLVSLRRKRIIPPNFKPGLESVLETNDLDRAIALNYCKDHPSPVAHVFAAGIRRLSAGTEAVEQRIQEAGEREVLRLRKYVRVLSVIAAVSPLLGLLGTIFGMIDAFQTVAMSGEALGRTELLAGGIYEAMITTAAGLIVAIPALIGYHFISARVDKLVMDIDEMTVDFIDTWVEPAPTRPSIAGVNGMAGEPKSDTARKPASDPASATS